MQQTMHNPQTLNRTLATIGDGTLLIWWGISILIDPITIGMSAIGTGLILLGVNAARWLNGIATKGSTTALGIIALVWGMLDTVFDPRFELSFAMLLVVIGVVILTSTLMHPKTS